MKSKLLKLFAALAVLIGLGVALLLWNINPILEKVRPQIISTLSDSIGHPVSIGEISADFFPSVGIRINDVGLSDSLEDASVQSLLLDTSLFSLLKGKIEVKKLQVKGARIKVLRHADGSLSIGALSLNEKVSGAKKDENVAAESQKEAQENDGEAAATTASDEPAEASSISFALQNADISDVSLSWIDESVSPPAEVSISDFSAEIRNLTSNTEGTLKVLASVLGKESENLSLVGTVELGESLTALPKLDVDFSLSRLDLARVSSLLSAYGLQPEDLRLGEELSYTMGIRLDENGIAISPSLNATAALLSFGEVFQKSAGTDLTVDIQAQPTLLGALTASKLDLDIAGIKLSAPLSFSQKNGAKVALRSSAFPLTALSALLPAAKTFGLGGDLAIALDIAAPAPSKKGAQGLPKLDGTIELQSISASVPAAEGGQPIPISDINGTLSFAGDSLVVKPLSLKVAGEKITAGANVKNFASPLASLAVQADSISLGPILSKLRADGAAPSALEQSTLNALVLTATHAMGSGKGNIKLSLGESSLAGAPLKRVSMNVATKLNKENAPESVVMDDATIEAFGGVIRSDFNLSKATAFAGKAQLNDLDLDALSRVALGADSSIRVKGTLSSLTAAYTGSLKDVAGSLKAGTSATLAKGEISGFNILGQTLGKINQIPGVSGSLGKFIPEKYRPVLEANSTQFDSITFKGDLANNTLAISTFELRHEIYILSGQGRVGLDGSIELKTQMRLTPALAEEMILKEPKLELLTDRSGNIVFPVVIKKSADGIPIVLPDVSGLLKRAAKNTAKEAGKRALDKVAPGLGGALDSLF